MLRPTRQNRRIAALRQLYGIPSATAPQVQKPRKQAVRRSQTLLRSESAEQSMLVRWLRLQNLLVHSIPNGGRRSVWTGERERAMGLLKGVCDLFLAEPRGKYHGFYIEMKSKGAKPRPEQLAFMAAAEQRGYAARWYDSFEAAQVGVEGYLKC